MLKKRKTMYIPNRAKLLLVKFGYVLINTCCFGATTGKFIKPINILSLVIFLFSCSPARNNEAFKKLSTEEQNKFQKYIIQGRGLYKANCVSCHQTDGKGVKKLIPPLAGSAYLKENQELVVELIKNGAKEAITVNGISYSPTMPAHAHLTHLEIAEIMTYINNSWGNEYGFVDGKYIFSLLK